MAHHGRVGDSWSLGICISGQECQSLESSLGDCLFLRRDHPVTSVPTAAPQVYGPAAVRADDDGDAMESLFQAACATWPEIDLPCEVFASYLRPRLPAGPREAALGQLRASDLYLACACSRGDPRALLILERQYIATLDVAVRKLSGATADIVDDVKQELRRGLLVGDARPPGIVKYAGRGGLRRWLRVIAVREAMAVIRRARREVSWEDDHEIAESAVRDNETQYLEKLYQAEFTGAVTDALGDLAGRDRALLRWSYVDGLSIDEIGRLRCVHRATAARWLCRAEAALSARTRAILMKKFAVSAGDLHGIVALIRSGLELSLSRVFGRVRTAERCEAIARRATGT